MNEPLGIALELAEKRKALAARMSPQARRLAFPDLHRVEVERRTPVRVKLKAVNSDWSTPKRLTVHERAMAAQKHADLIVNTCARIFGVPVNMIYEFCKVKTYVLPRRAAMNLMKQQLHLSTPTIGYLLNGRDHTTTMWALQKHEETYDTNPDYARKYDAAEAEVRAAFRETADAGPPAGGEVDGRTERSSHPSSANIKAAA